ncbi:GlxA family transcriptional regulator [Bradyrhizobium tropiciagri]|uniref:GlxA family transcriptional regulator n=1 Tax=Bradyrhizobium tropiciagri TaxID=312253 RepID=UPI001BAD343D|nr:GlxA family transcriptional regulator [Bradyrhizobium tropiciagri]MBR0896714.1 GlxA family transcriptional regulator [Bradyrhizobium tropiciagri]
MERRSVALTIHDGMTGLDAIGPIDVFATANLLLGPGQGYEIVLVAKDLLPIRTSGGVRLIPDKSYAEACGPYDIALVAGGPVPARTERDKVLSEWLASVARSSKLYGSICTGAFALGHAGLLDGHTVTTHWDFAADLSRQFPAATVEADRIYVRSGSVVTSAGVTAGIDLALALVDEHHGARLSLEVARQLVVVAQRQGGQSQFSPHLAPPPSGEPPIAQVQAYVVREIRSPLGLERLAAVAGMSVRSFSRHFHEQTGVSPHDFVEQSRTDAARRMLESSGLSLKAIAFESGFQSADYMRRVFNRRLGIAPSDYRLRFQRRSK